MLKSKIDVQKRAMLLFQFGMEIDSELEIQDR